jgi:hypothetical protein
VIRKLIARGEVVWLSTPWPCVYEDLVGDRLHLVGEGSALRTQAKNARREAGRYAATGRPNITKSRPALRLQYLPAHIRSDGSVLAAMMRSANLDMEGADFRLPVPAEWRDMADRWEREWDRRNRPLMILRPLTVRREWGGAAPRNPDAQAYAELYRRIRDRYFVVSVADLEPGQEWIVGETLGADVQLHAGELPFQAMAALFERSELVFTAPGFALILAQAVGARHVAIYGGYESPRSFSAGAGYAPHLTISPVETCECFDSRHDCRKAIDLAEAIERLDAFMAEA